MVMRLVTERQKVSATFSFFTSSVHLSSDLTLSSPLDKSDFTFTAAQVYDSVSSLLYFLWIGAAHSRLEYKQ